MPSHTVSLTLGKVRESHFIENIVGYAVSVTAPERSTSVGANPTTWGPIVVVTPGR